MSSRSALTAWLLPHHADLLRQRARRTSATRTRRSWPTRWRATAGSPATDVFFLTGTDEHGDKIAQAAAHGGRAPAGARRPDSRALPASSGSALGITYDDFIRTTEPRHETRGPGRSCSGSATQGEIYFGKYGGQYCYGCERFYTEKEIVDGKCPDHQTPLTYIEEENYFFRMSKYQDWLIDATSRTTRTSSGPSATGTRSSASCASRSRTSRSAGRRRRLEWGIPLPFDDRYVTYVWFDALLNYVSALGDPGDDRFRRFWPHVQHLIGKDILKPHGVYWPCMLKAAGSPRPGLLPARLRTAPRARLLDARAAGRCRSARQRGRGAGQLTRKYGNDAFRYFVLREMPFGLDANFTEEALVERLNADLANDLGNLVSPRDDADGELRPAGRGDDAGAGSRGARRSRERGRRDDARARRAGDGRVRVPARRWSRSGASSAAVNRYVDADAAVGARQGSRRSGRGWRPSW